MKNKSAYTLIEILAATAIAAILTYSLTRVLIASLRTWETTSKYISQCNEIEEAIYIITKDLESLHQETQGDFPFFIQDSAYYLKTSANKVICYSLRKAGDTKKSLHRETTSYRPELTFPEHFTREEEHPLFTVICPNVDSFSLSYNQDSKTTELSLVLHKGKQVNRKVFKIQETS